MLRRLNILALFVLISICTSANASPKQMGLAECFRLALQHGLEMPLADLDITQARARYTQALGTVLPVISVSATETLQDPIASSTFAG